MSCAAGLGEANHCTTCENPTLTDLAVLCIYQRQYIDWNCINFVLAIQIWTFLAYPSIPIIIRLLLLLPLGRIAVLRT